MGLVNWLRMRVRKRLIAARLPRVIELTDFDRAGVRFDVSNLVEHHRVVDHGGESEYTAAMLGELRADDVLYDIGANLGLVALHAASICRVVAFEPDPEIAARLRLNLTLNPTRHVEVVEIAVSDDDSTATLYSDGPGGMSPSLAHQRGEKGAVPVATRSLDSLRRSGELPPPTVLKLDIEGAEVLALRGAAELLTSEGRPRSLFIEVHDSFLPGFGSSGDEVRAMLADYGYTHEKYRAPRAGQHHLILEPASSSSSS
jgi:FkbM family methyltransferase